jgi:hypothetical protein
MTAVKLNTGKGERSVETELSIRQYQDVEWIHKLVRLGPRNMERCNEYCGKREPIVGGRLMNG